MIPYRWPVLSAVPRTLEKRLEIARAIQALGAPDEAETVRRRLAEIAALRRDLQKLALAVHELRRACDPRLRSYVIKYSPDQPRVPAGNLGGGQWTSEGGSGSASEGTDFSAPNGAFSPVRSAALDTGTITDVSNDARGQVKSSENPDARFAQDFPLGAFPSQSAPSDYKRIRSSDIPPDHPKHPVKLFDNENKPITDDDGHQLVRPADLPPETYVRGGLGSNVAIIIAAYKQVQQSDPGTETPLLLALRSELSPLGHGGTLDAEPIRLELRH